MSVNLESDQPDQAIAQKRKPLVRPYSSKPIIKKSASEKDLVIDLKSRRTSVQRYDSNENKTPFPKPGITAKSWIIYDVEKQEVFQSKKDSIKRQVASLTKIMTFYTCLKLIDKYGVNPYQTKITVSKIASSINGTSAQLKEGDALSIQELFYGLMLPSGNDAAYALAEHFGTLLSHSIPPKANQYEQTTSVIRYFIKEMNYNAMRLKMSQTQFDSPHGLSNKYNYSTAKDICRLSTVCMQLPRFRQVVGTRIYKAKAHNNEQSTYTWESTNRLLGKQGWVGCKTGVTDPAGPCFSGWYQGEGGTYCVVVLKSRSMEQRWVEVPKMVQWAIKCKEYVSNKEQASQNKAAINAEEKEAANVEESNGNPQTDDSLCIV
ncbi:hypothetical protein FGO68_gene11227 [Halteria grandinella]|uniref:Peptidase S11 D-alanyl-D-alanine carboxypeptidase A N-terminal domain-containing protein n=1 Tax=Halteria grandinella TaxID=5974 RepID=A0A8J8T4T4_HALGN|nr:hypothetical protein FGO68_gene11227 [Halteria grandinella]